jgi:molecular chaperone DnaK
MGKAIGIDLGTTNSVVAFKDIDVRIVQIGIDDLCHSCVAYDKRNDQFIIGNVAYQSWKRYTPNIVVSAKRLMGCAIKDDNVKKMQSDKRAYPFGIMQLNGGTEDSVAIVLNGRQYTPEQISGMILGFLKSEAGKKLGDITHAVITVPAYFTEKQRTATKKAAEFAGLKVQQLLAEPTAAAISYGFDQIKNDEAKNLLIYDFGGGTFDLSILAAAGGQFVEMGAGGDRWLGGDDIDRLLSNYVCKQIEKENNLDLQELLDSKRENEVKTFYAGLKLEVEKAKKALGTQDVFSVPIGDFLEDEDGDPLDEIDIRRDTFEAMIRPLISRTIDLIEELMKNTSMTMDLIDNILLVGGSSCIPLVKQMLSEKYGKEKVKLSEKPMLAVAEGAAILAQSLPVDDTDEIPDWEEAPESKATEPVGDRIFVPSTKKKTFIKIETAEGSKMEKVIDSQEPLPCETNRKFYTMVDNQKIVQVEIFNDAENESYERVSIGFFAISEDLPAHSELNFKFMLDLDDTMRATVKESTGKTHQLVLGRGYNDTSCLSAISYHYDEIMNDNRIAANKKAVFIKRIQQIIDEIEKCRLEPTDGKWNEFESRIDDAATNAKLGEEQSGENNLGEILAKILLSEFGEYIDSEDRTEMRTQIQNLSSANTPFEKQLIFEKLHDIAVQYSILLHIKLFDVVAHSASNAQQAARASAVFDECKTALQMRNIAQIRQLMLDNADLLKNEDGETISIGAGIII